MSQSQSQSAAELADEYERSLLENPMFFILFLGVSTMRSQREVRESAAKRNRWVSERCDENRIGVAIAYLRNQSKFWESFIFYRKFLGPF